MAVVSSGRIGLKSDVVKEFGGTAPDRASEYYRAPTGVVPNTISTSVVTPNYVPGNSVPGNIIWNTGVLCCKKPCGPVGVNAECRCCAGNMYPAYCCHQYNPPSVNPGYWTTTSKQGSLTVNQDVPQSGSIKWSNWYGARKT
jgi:hypothetical protein